MLEYINNLNLESSINKEEIFNLFKTTSSDINSTIQSKIDSSKNISDFFNKYTNINMNSISSAIDNFNHHFSNILIPSSNHFNENLEVYINVVSTIILVIHYCLKIKTIVDNKLKEIQQNFTEGILNNKLEEPYKDKIIEFNLLSNSALSLPSQKEINFSNYIDNRPKIFNHFDSNQRNFIKGDPTPKFFVFENDPKSPLDNDNLNKEIENKENETKENKKQNKKYNNSPCSLITMSSISVINKNPEEKKNVNKKRIHSQINPLKKGIKLNGNHLIVRKNVSDKYLGKNEFSKETNRKNINKASRKSVSSCMERNLNNSSNKDLVVEFFKFVNELYKDKYIDESQKKNLKQLIIKYITLKK